MQWFSRNDHVAEADLSALLDSELSERQRARAEAHVGSCASCRQRLEELREVRSLVASLPVVQATRSFTLTPDMAGARPSSAPPAGARNRFFLAPAAAFAVLLALVAVDLFQTSGTSQDEAANLAFSEGATTMMTADSAAPEAAGAGAASSAGQASADDGSDKETAPDAETGPDADQPLPQGTPGTPPDQVPTGARAAEALAPEPIAAAPAEDLDSGAEGDGGLNWLRAGQVIAGIVLAGSLAYLVVPVLLRKGS